MGNQCQPCLQDDSLQNNQLICTHFIKSDRQYYDAELPPDDNFLQPYLKQSFWSRNQKKLKKNHNNSTYFYGDWLNGLPQGRGILYEPLKILIDANFQHGVPNGHAKIIFILKKSEYEGELKNGKITGKGSMINHRQMYSFSGEWNDSEPQTGTLLLTRDKNIEKVEFLDFKQKIARIFYRDGRIYEGQVDWKLLKPHGKGKVKFGTFDIKDFYEGEWKNGIYEGRGTFYWKNGEFYTGYYRGGQKDGWGKFKFTTGNEYQGEWLLGKQHGNGVVYDKNGFKIRQGKWNMGSYIGPNRFHHGEHLFRSENNIHYQDKGGVGKEKHQSTDDSGLFDSTKDFSKKPGTLPAHQLKMRNIKTLYDY